MNPPTATPTVAATPTPFAVSGAVQFFAGTVPVPSVTVVATGAGEVSTSTAVNGTYTVSPLPAGGWTLTPHKTGGANLGISTLDAAWVLQHIAGTRPFGPAQNLACDVTGDGSCSTLDATVILQLKASIITRLPAAATCDSDWLFQPLPGTGAVPDADPTAVERWHDVPDGRDRL